MPSNVNWRFSPIELEAVTVGQVTRPFYQAGDIGDLYSLCLNGRGSLASIIPTLAQLHGGVVMVGLQLHLTNSDDPGM